MSHQLMSTTAAARLVNVSPKSFKRWARAHQVAPLGRKRIGRSFVTVWLLDEIVAGALN